MGILDMASGAWPRFAPVVAVLTLLPLLIVWDRSLRRAAAEGAALLDLATDLGKRVREARTAIVELAKEAETTNGDLAADFERRLKEAEARQEREEYEAEALEAFLSEVDSLLPMNWVPRPFKKIGWLGYVIMAIAIICSGAGIAFLISYLDDGLKSAAVAPVRVGLASALVGVAIFVALETWQRKFTTATVLLVLILIVGIPVSGWVDGRVSASVDWNSSDRADHFEQVVLYSELQLFDEWEQTEGALFASPELLLIKETGDSYVVAADGSSDKVTVISSNTITHVDYFR